MSRLRGIVKAVVALMLPQRSKEAIIDHAVRRLPRLSFPPLGLRHYNRIGIQKPPPTADPWMTQPDRN